ncbi:MAG: transglutaminase domain-containing protein [Clostridiales bacterium]|nr:transglutaminase domain-containing protein [Clostridiales bacterium]
MLYEKYQKRIQRVSRLLSVLIKYALLIGAAIIVAVLITTAIVVYKGSPTRVKCANEIYYGDAYTCRAYALCSKVRIEFTLQGSDEWTQEKPIMPGNYLARAVGISSSNQDVYGKISEFTILPRKVDVAVINDSVIYGNMPSVGCDTAYEDKLLCDNIIYESLANTTTKVKPDVSSIKFLDSEGNDISSAYSVNIVESDITLIPRNITITVESASKVYDGDPLSLNAYAITEGSLAFGDSLYAKSPLSITNVGSFILHPQFFILQSDGNTSIDVTHLYCILTVTGTLEVTPRVLKIHVGSIEGVYTGEGIRCEDFEIDSATPPLDGHKVRVISSYAAVGCGTYQNKLAVGVYDEDNLDQSSNYAIYYVNGSITITPKPITVYTPDIEWVYNGLTHYHYEVSAEGLVKGHSIKADPNKMTSLIVDVGVGKNKLTALIFDSVGKDVTHNYTLSYVYGTLKVVPRPITFKTADSEWMYDGQPHSLAEFETISDLTLLWGHKLVPINTATITDAGTQANTFTSYKIVDSYNADKTFCYDVSFQNGTLTVEERPITVKPDDTQKIYDATPLYGGRIIVHTKSPYQLVEGHVITGKSYGSRIEVGTTLLGVESVAIHSNGIDVTHNYKISTLSGYATVTKRPITLLTGSAEKTYDGTPLTESSYLVPKHSRYQLINGHTITATTSGQRTKIGESPNTCIASKTKIMHMDVDVTSNYDIKYEYGTLKVNPYAVISIITNSKVKVYDGQRLTDGGYEVVVVHGELKSGHYVEVDVYGAIINPGSSPNRATAVVYDRDGINVSSLYELNISPGTLQIVSMDYNQYDSTVFGQVQSNRGGTVYLAMKSHGNYNGQSWLGGIDYGKTLPGGYSYNYLTSIALRNMGKKPYLVKMSRGFYYMLPCYLGFEGDYVIQESDVEYSGTERHYSAEYYLPISGLNGYEAYKGNLGEYSQYEKEYREFVYQNYLTVDPDTANYMNTLIVQNNFTLNDPNVIQRIAHYVQNSAVYSLDYDRHLDVEDNVVIAFLSNYMEGSCEHFASAATLLYRTLGIPARYVTGWMVDTVKDQPVNITNPAHAWVEVYIDDLGWVMVDVTNIDPNAPNKSVSEVNNAKPTITLMPRYTYAIWDGKAHYALQDIEHDEILSELLSKGYTYYVEVTGHGYPNGKIDTSVGIFKLYDPLGNNVTHLYNYSYVYGVIEIFEPSTKIIKVYLHELQKIYDGKPLSFKAGDYSIIEIEPGVELTLSLNISRTDAGFLTLSEINENRKSYVTYNVTVDGKDVTEDYVLVFDTYEDSSDYYVPLRILPREIGLSSATEVKLFDGNPLTNSNVFISNGSLVNGDTLNAYAIGYMNNIGSTKNHISSQVAITNSLGEDVTNNYSISFDNVGTLTIIDEDDDD